MKAWTFSAFGEPDEVLELKDSWPVPKRQAGQVLVRQASTSVNPVEGKVIRSGTAYGAKPPKVPGGDIAGVVDVADADSKFSKGDKVFALSSSFAGNPVGSWAEYTIAEESWLAAVPSNLDLKTEAGAVPLVSLTAFQALSTSGLPPQSGPRVLVHAGAGGVGSWAVQLAKVHWNAYVVATGGPKTQEYLIQELGVDEAFDYTQEKLSEKFASQPFDIIVDVIGGDTEVESYKVLSKNGTYAHIHNTGTDNSRVEAGEKWTHGPKYTHTLVKPDGASLTKIAEYLEAGKVRQIVAKTYPFEQAREALAELEKGHTKGKIVIQVQS